MRLTETLRSAYVRAAMKDVPAVDYGTKLHDMVEEKSFANIPARITSSLRDKSERKFLATDFDRGTGYYLYLAGPLTAEDRAELAAVKSEMVAQRDKLGDLERKLRQVARGCTTTKQLRDALPEFAKYLPAEGGAVDRSVPAVANVVADFVKAGWPK